MFVGAINCYELSILWSIFSIHFKRYSRAIVVANCISTPAPSIPAALRQREECTMFTVQTLIKKAGGEQD